MEVCIHACIVRIHTVPKSSCVKLYRLNRTVCAGSLLGWNNAVGQVVYNGDSNGQGRASLQWGQNLSSSCWPALPGGAQSSTSPNRRICGFH
eukprot:1605261-Alexandrium_andersonii.AAC.1